MKKIEKITIKRMIDENPDLDYLGKFSDKAGEYAIKHSEGSANLYQYFNAENVDNMKQAKENYNRIMEYEKGNLCDYGIKAVAEIRTSQDEGNTWLINSISSGGLWGLSSDGTEEDFIQEGSNQLEDLKDVLLELGFEKKEIEAVKVERDF